MPAGPSLLKGCLPVWIEVSAGKDADTPNGAGEYWEEVDAIYWLKRDGTKGSHISEKLWEEAEKEDYGFCNMLEGFWDTMRHEQEEAKRLGAGCICSDAEANACVKDCEYKPFVFD